jgi:hypothetical protein
MSGWFEVDRAGLAAIAKRRGMAFIVTEPVQNAWDEDTTEVHITLEPVAGKPRAILTVTDDSPDGFRDLTDSYMMFRQSYKINDPEKRGRFNVGEKLLLAVARCARVTSTTGSVIFGEKGRTRSRRKTEAGSVLTAELMMTREEVAEALKLATTLIPPDAIKTYVNGELLARREAIVRFDATLETEIQGDEGGFKYTTRKTVVRVYEPQPGEEPTLYEMGIPIDTLDCAWHVNIMQKVPLSVDRASVRFGYLRSVARKAAENMADHMSEEVARQPWVSDALERMDDDDAVRTIIKQRFGDAVVQDPSSPEANKRAMDAGYSVIGGNSLTKAAWATVRRAEAIKPAGKVFSTGKVDFGPDGAPTTERGKWTKAMERVADYCYEFSAMAVGHELGVEYVDDPLLGIEACMGSGRVTLNIAGGIAGRFLSVVSSKLDDPNGYMAVHKYEEFNALLIHECAHVKAKDHLTDKFNDECCRIGAKLRGFQGTVDVS